MNNDDSKLKITDWLPTTKKEVEKRGWSELDVIIVSGDAYVDHPSFGHAVVGRIIEGEGLKVGIIAQPNWQDDLRDFKKLGKPRLFFGVTAGCMDSMVNHYTANKRLRSSDAYTPGGKSGFRPDDATITYTKILKKIYPDTPVMIGGIEASLRRVTHYDYWKGKLRPSILEESGADLLIYGMGELPLKEMITLLKKNVPFSSLKTIPQTAIIQESNDSIPKNKKWNNIEINSHESCISNKKLFASNFKSVEIESNKINASRLIQNIGEKRLVINPPFKTMTEKEIDSSFDLPYTRLPHPKYKKRGDIPAFEMIKFSVNMHRGCFGGCSFCTISAHQGKFIASRSKKSILSELDKVCQMPGFKGYISDLGGPSANMYKMGGSDKSVCERCIRPSCIFPNICKNLNISHRPTLDVYSEALKNKDIKKIFVTSGIRYDMLVGKEVVKRSDKENGFSDYINQVISNHVSGRLKVAPEHTSDKVLSMMRKPSFELFKKFKRIFDSINSKKKLNQQLIPYFISSHPDCDLKDMANLASETNVLGLKLEQIQDFTPTPMTVSTVIYYSGYDPYTLEPVYTPNNKFDKLDQRKFFFWYKKENRDWVISKLKSLGELKLLGRLFPEFFKQGFIDKGSVSNSKGKKASNYGKRSNYKSKRRR